MSRACVADNGLCVMGTTRPCTFIDGGTPAVMKRSDAFLCTISLRNEVKSKSLMARTSRNATPTTNHLLEDFLVARVARRLLAGHQAALDQILQVLVQRLHAV